MSRNFNSDGFTSSTPAEPIIEATPLVVNGVIFITEPPSSVVALDAKSGKVIWRYSRNLSSDLPLCCRRVNRGLAVLGKSLFWGTFGRIFVCPQCEHRRGDVANAGRKPLRWFHDDWSPTRCKSAGRGRCRGRRVWHSRISGGVRLGNRPATLEILHNSWSWRAWPRDLGKRCVANGRRTNMDHGQL